MTHIYKTHGTCSRQITIEYDDKSGIINDVSFVGGCNGNLKGISALVRGKNIDEIIPTLKGITCGMKTTSCPDQLAIALEEIKEEL